MHKVLHFTNVATIATFYIWLGVQQVKISQIGTCICCLQRTLDELVTTRRISNRQHSILPYCIVILVDLVAQLGELVAMLLQLQINIDSYNLVTRSKV